MLPTVPPADTDQTATASISNGITQLIWGGGLFVASGRGAMGGGTLYTSPDGAAWTPQSAGANAQVSLIAYGNGVFVGGDRAATATLTSADAIQWTSHSQSFGFQGTYLMWFADGHFFLPDSNGAWETSTDGIAWTANPVPGTTYIQAVVDSSRVGVVAWGRTSRSWSAATELHPTEATSSRQALGALALRNRSTTAPSRPATRARPRAHSRSALIDSS